MRCFIKFFNNPTSMIYMDVSWQSIMWKWLSSIFPCASVAIFARILPHAALPYGQTARNASVVLRPQPLALDLCSETLNISEFDKSRSCVQCNLQPMIGNQFSFSDQNKERMGTHSRRRFSMHLLRSRTCSDLGGNSAPGGTHGAHPCHVWNGNRQMSAWKRKTHIAI